VLPAPTAATNTGNNRKQMSLLSAALAPLTDDFSEVNLLIIALLGLELGAGKDRSQVIKGRIKPGWKSMLVRITFSLVLKSGSNPGKTKIHFFSKFSEEKRAKGPRIVLGDLCFRQCQY